MAEGDEDHTGKWAEARTDWAEDRTVLAVERTFAGWLRTALASVGIGLGFRALFSAWEPAWAAKAIATLFIMLGALLAIGAERRACRSFKRLQTHEVKPAKGANLRWAAWALVIGALVLVAGLWLLGASPPGD
ncbi:conserved hypothetical protein [Altererythrobacter sp. B11]|uniref:YidH family protein n=1 Tax=Altererythrobacter sp. B11 TaxID=2060312 RepID=UPI000DC71A47|nr:DUF202 domain-containing protein [Altererythrobacter sp. B11]BBC71622.1 conserved hypothetical protein [Altererythrobacter sp. B11]